MTAYKPNCTTPCEAKALAHSERALAAWRHARFGALPIATASAILEDYATVYENSYVFDVLYGFFGRKERLILAGETARSLAKTLMRYSADMPDSPHRIDRD